MNTRPDDNPAARAAIMADTVPGFALVAVPPADLAALAASMGKPDEAGLRKAWRLLQDAAKVIALESESFATTRKARRGRKPKETPREFTGTRAERALHHVPGGPRALVPVTPLELVRVAVASGAAHLAGLRAAWLLTQSAAACDAEQRAAFDTAAGTRREEKDWCDLSGFDREGWYPWEKVWPKLNDLLKHGQEFKMETRRALALPRKGKIKGEGFLLALMMEADTPETMPWKKRAALAREMLATLKREELPGDAAAELVATVKVWRRKSGRNSGKAGRAEGRRKSDAVKHGPRIG